MLRLVSTERSCRRYIGASHDFDGDYDEKRENYLISLVLKVYRITVGDVMKNMDFVLMGLENYIIKEYGDVIKV